MPASAKKLDFSKIARQENRSPLYHGIAPERARIHSIWPRMEMEGPAYTMKSSIPSTSTRKGIRKQLKRSWILEGEDREAAFVFALRKLYRSLPDTVTPKQLFGLSAYGLRFFDNDEATGEPRSRVQPADVHGPDRRYLTFQELYSSSYPKKLLDSEGPKQLCTSIKDSILGLLNAYRLGYVHREIMLDSVLIIKPQLGYLLSEDGTRVEGKAAKYTGFLYDFTNCYRHRGEDEGVSGDHEQKDPCLSTPTLLLENRESVAHSPIHDLESFLWILVCSVADVVQSFAMGQRVFKDDCLCQDVDDLPTLIEQTELDDSDGKEVISSEMQVEAQDDSGDEGDCDDAKSDATIRGGANDGSKTEDEATLNESEVMDIDGDQSLVSADEIQQKQVEERAKQAGDASQEQRRPDNTANVKEEGPHQDHKRKPSRHIEKEEGTKRQKSVADLTGEDKEVKDEPMADEGKPEEEATGAKEDAVAAAPESQKAPASPDDGATAWAYEPVTRDIRNLLEPPLNVHIYVSTREMFLEKLDKMIEGSPCMAPFYHLLCALRSIAAGYYGRSLKMLQQGGRATFTPDEVEEAFTGYLSAFKTFMPQEEKWDYMKEYLHVLRTEYIARRLPSAARKE